MEITKCPGALHVRSNIHFDETDLFCIRPYVVLYAYREPYAGWENAIGISVEDYDDFDIGLIYQTDGEHFIKILDELINWMADHEKGISSFHTLFNDPYRFFPDLGCERRRW